MFVWETVSCWTLVLGQSYNWSPTNTLSCTNCQMPFAFPSGNTLYTMVSMTSSSCPDTSWFYVMVDSFCNPVSNPCDTLDLFANFGFSVNANTVLFTDSCSGADLDYVGWDFGDGNVASFVQPGNSISHFYSAVGSYYVCVFANKVTGETTTCQDTFCQWVVIDSIPPTSIDDVMETSWNLYPNPSDGTIWIEFSEEDGKRLQLQAV